jgi:Protein of unknown function (DUF2934)
VAPSRQTVQQTGSKNNDDSVCRCRPGQAVSEREPDARYVPGPKDAAQCRSTRKALSVPNTAVPVSVQRNVEATRNQPAATQSPATQAGSSQSSEAASQNDIAQLAYALWQQRGCPEGSAESDWLEAEQNQLHNGRPL